MSFLISKTELEETLKNLGIIEYYVDIDMNGALGLYLGSRFANFINQLIELLKKIDFNRSTDEIYKQNEIFYPVKRIEVDDADDEETSRRLVKKDFKKARFSQQLNSWVSKGSRMESKIPRVAFYSYKGGVGRSTTLAIVARLLAREGYKVAVIDLDLEAPGLNSLLFTKQKPSPFGVVDYLYHTPWTNKIEQKRFLSQYVVREDISRRNKQPGQIILMSAGGTQVEKNEDQISFLFDEENINIKLEPHYLNKLSFIDFDVYSRQSTHIFENLLNDMATHTGADIILFDARTGFSNVSGALLNQFSDVISVHVQNNHQNKEGIEFIAKHVSKEKLSKTIWSNTKVPDSNKTEVDLKHFIKSKVYKNNEYDVGGFPLYHELPYDSHLDNINSHRLKYIIDNDRPFITPYLELTEQIISMTDLDKKMPNYIDDGIREKILNELKELFILNRSVKYISQRFLAEDLEIFVGFPGSGKKTFSGYMKEVHNKNIQVVDFEQFREMDNSAHRILSHAIFLDWNIEEATQAVCKLFLLSPTFIQWLSENPYIVELTDPSELIRMRDESEYELEPRIATEILELIFEENRRLVGGWRYIFSRLQYREGYVLPFDIMIGVKKYAEYWIDKFENGKWKNRGTKSLFPINMSSSFYKKIWIDIGKRKSDWLMSFDPDLLNLVLEVINLKVATKYRALEEAKSKLIEQFREVSHIEFEKVFEKAISLEIIRKRYLKEHNMIMLSPVYQLIDIHHIINKIELNGHQPGVQ